MKKQIIKLLSFVTVSLLLVGCGEKKDVGGEVVREEVAGSGYQFEEPDKGDTIAEIVVKDYGTIVVRFFEEEAPKAVENFITHSKEGYYNGLTFHRVMNEFMIQGGDPEGVGSGGESIWDEDFEDEFSDKLYPYRGALCMANAGPNTNGSQFFIVQLKSMSEELLAQLENDYGKIEEDARANYLKMGGTPWLHNAHTVFGQMLSGYDVLDSIAAVETDQNNMPATPVVIDTIRIIEY